MFDHITQGLGGGAFEMPIIQEIYQRLGLHSFKMSSQKKVDITLILSSNSGMSDQAQGFSIKSQLGSPSTLLNASAATNIYYNVDSAEESIHLKEAELSHYRDILNFCKANKIQIKYSDYASQVFKDNLSFFGNDFPEFFAEVVRSYVSGDAKTRLLSELVVVNSSGPRDLARREFQMKSFLRAVALGLVPNSPWDGNLKGYGGYLIVKDSGELLCFLLENDDEFKSYLYLDTSLTTPKNDLFAATTYEQDSARVALNAQIRFLK
jgi:type II restriction enzyme